MSNIDAPYNPPDDPPDDPPDEPPDDSPENEDGADVLAFLLGQLDDERAAAVEKALADHPEIREEARRLRADLRAWSDVATKQAAPHEPLRALRAEIADEAAERRADAARRRAEFDDGTRADLVALALGELDDPAVAALEQRALDDVVLAVEIDAVRELATATRRALTIEPSVGSLDAIRAQMQDAAPAGDHGYLRDVPLPGAQRPRTPSTLRWLAPLAIAATIVVSVALFHGSIFTGSESNGGHDGAHLTSGGLWLDPLHVDGERTWLDSSNGGFEFADGNVIEAGPEPVTLRVACRTGAVAAAAGDALTPGTAELELHPGARVSRLDSERFELLAGRLRVTAEELPNALQIRSGSLYAAVIGTTFEVTAVEGRLVVVVQSGTVTIGREAGPAGTAESADLSAGEQGLIDGERLLLREADGRPAGDVFLAPRAVLRGPDEAVRSGSALELRAELGAGEGGVVTIGGFDDSVPTFLIRLKGPGGAEREVKVQRSMLAIPPPDAATWRLDEDSPYVLDVSLPTDELEPGRWEARLRYLSYRRNAEPAEWLGTVESPPIPFEVKR